MNSENKENLSNYKLLKRKPSVCSTSLHFSKLITVVQFFFRVTPILQWFQLNFGAGNFLGRRPGTSALRMLRRLTAVCSAANATTPGGFWKRLKPLLPSSGLDNSDETCIINDGVVVNEPVQICSTNISLRPHFLKMFFFF